MPTFTGLTTLSISSNAGASLFFFFFFFLCYQPTLMFYSLEKDPPRRATPWRMLDHPWMQDIRNKKINMANFIRKVWGWKN
jgi:hypothetical protein